MPPHASYLVFISCPGDVAEEKLAVVGTIAEVDRLFRPHGVELRAWRYETDALPLAGSDTQTVVNRQLPTNYDLYVGLMGEHFGTPTPRAGSGTEEEFNDALARQKETGRPPVLFYFRRRPAIEGAPAADERVTRFRRCYPGLYGSFQDSSELAALLKDHLVALLLRRSEPLPVRGARAWADRLARVIDAQPLTEDLFGLSSERAVRAIERLWAAFDFGSLLSVVEQEALLAAAYLRVLRQRTNCAGEILHRELQPGFKEEFVFAVETIADRAAYGELRPTSGSHDLVRHDVLAALLRVGDLLVGDRQSLHPDWQHRAENCTDNDVLARAWLAATTPRVFVTRGIPCLHLSLSPAQRTEEVTLRRIAGLCFEASWHGVREVLAPHGFAIARAPHQFSPSSATPRLPETVWPLWKERADRAAKLIVELVHLGEGDSPSRLDGLLPLPYSHVREPLTIRVDPAGAFTLDVRTEEEGKVVFTAGNNGEGEIKVPLEALPAGVPCAWQLSRDFGGFEKAVRNGTTRRLTSEEALLLETARHEPAILRSRKFGLKLWSELLCEVWPLQEKKRLDASDAAMLFEALHFNHEWILAHPADPVTRDLSSQLELIRDAANAVRVRLLQYPSSSPP